jgi:hypothetical protein
VIIHRRAAGYAAHPVAPGSGVPRCAPPVPPAGRDAPAQVPAAPGWAAMALHRDWILAGTSTELDSFRAYYEACFPRPGVVRT